MSLTQNTPKEECFEVLEYDVKDLPPSMIERARKELGETDEIKTRSLKELIGLIKEEKELIVPLDEDYLLQFLRGRKFDAKKAFEVMKNFWQFIRKYHHVYKNIQVHRIEEILLQNTIGVLPYRDRYGSVVFIFKIGQWDTNKYSFEDFMQVACVLLNVSICNPATQICGYRFIFDLRGFSWAHMKLCLMNFKMALYATHNGFPARYKGSHCVSGNSLFKHLMQIIHPLLPSKIKKRVFCHDSDAEILREFVHPSVLPREFGGEGENLNNGFLWEKNMEKKAKQHIEFLNNGYKS